MIRVLVSSCLLGERVRYHGGDARRDDPVLERWLAEGRVVPFCPEVEGGLGVPRPAAEIRGGDGRSVVEGRAEVVTAAGEIVTEAFAAGARGALETCRRQGVRLAVLTDRSPSCGSTLIYDGTFSGTRRPGVGVTCALLEDHGIAVFAPDALEEARRHLERLEDAEAAGGGTVPSS